MTADLRTSLAAEVPGLLRYARTISPNAGWAQDLVQDTLVRALERSASYRGEASLATWLHRILHNLAVDSARRERETPVGGAEMLESLVDDVERRWREDDYTVDAATVAERAETRAELEDALIHLPFGYRTTVVLHDAEGMTVAQIAQIQDVSLSAAKARLRRGRMMLVTALAEGAEGRRATPGVPMRCWDARSRVSDYLDDELAAGDRLLIESHLEGCPTCPPLYAGLVGARSALSARRDPDTVVPPELAARIATLLGT